MKLWGVLGLALAASSLTACVDDSMYSTAACVDTVSNIRLDDSACSPNYGGPLGTHSWAYHSYHYGDPYQPVVIVGQPMPRSVYVYQRPARVSVSHISALQPARPPAVAPARNPGIQRGGLGNPAARVNTPPPVRTLNSPAPGRTAPKASPKTTK